MLTTGTTSVGSGTQPLLSFGTGGSVTFAPGQTGQALTVNGTAYTLLRSMADVAGLNGQSGAYALAGDLNAPGTAYSDAVAKGFSGTLEGLGHTITGLTITASMDPTSGTDRVGLIGTLASGGTVRDIGLIGGSVTGRNYVGGLVGYSSGGTVTQAYATGAVAGSSTVGGLVGYNNTGTIVQAYATGAVSGSNNAVGGLVGNNPRGTITQAYATGAVTGPGFVGGLVGYNYGGKVTQAYATGAVSGSSSGSTNIGGLVGYNYSGTVTQSYWDTQTSGQGTGLGSDNNNQSGNVTGLTTAQFQSGSAAGLGSAFAGGTNGLYPYLKNFFPNGVQAITGTAYRDAGATPAASGTAGAVTVSVDVGGARLSQTATTGANGVYYIALPAGTLADGTAFVASVPTSGSLSKAAATLATASTANPVQARIDLYGGALTVPTAATTLSAAPDLATARTSANAAAGSDTQGLIAGLTGRGLVTTGAGFTIDQAVNTDGAFLVRTTAPGAGLTVAQPVTVADGGSLSLSAAGALAINADITAKGAVPVALAYDRNTTTPAPTDLSFAQGRSLSFANADGSAATAAVTGQALTINGTGYTLVYTMGQLAGIGLGDRVALATDLFATSDGTAGGTPKIYTTAVIAGGTTSTTAPTAFSGTLEGLGHTVSNLTIDGGSNNFVGLIGYATGTVRDIGLLGGSVKANAYVGGLVGSNYSGTVVQAYATGAVAGSSTVGGLVGYNNTGTIVQAYATGAVSGSNNAVGGLVGNNPRGTITQAYATGAVTGPGFVGGLVGYNYGGKVTQAYATGAVSGSSSGSTNIGGLVGYNYSGTVTQSYWDTQTSGQGTGLGSDNNNQSGNVTGLTTAQFQSGSAAGLGSAFAGGTNGLYPYLKNFFPNGVQAITGTAYRDAGATPAASGTAGAVTVSVDVGGARLSQTATTGANGVYYIALPAGTLADGTAFVASVPTSGSLSKAAATLATASTANPVQARIDLYGGALTVPTAATTLSAAPDLATARTSANAAAGSDTQGLIAGLTGRGLVTTGAGFTIDQAVNTDGAFLVRTTAPGAGLTVAQPVTVADGGSLSLSAAGALAINTDVVAKGAVPVALAYDRNTTTPAPTDLSFAQGRSLRFANADGSAATAAVTGQALTINGTGYTLVYTMGQLAGIGLGDRVALATDLFATSDGTAGGTPKTYTTAVIAGGTTSTTAPTAFSGTLEGLGHTVSNLTIDGGSNNFVGLIGYATGTVRDIGLLGGSVKGRGEVGGLVGYNSGGTVAQAYATGAVSGTGYVGGLVGYNDQGTIVQAYATGAVSGSEDHVGGLVSVNDSGKVTQSYATGPVAGRDFVGGLIGLNDGGTVRQTYATGAVSGSSYVGGLIGASNGTVAQSYWDTQTSGRTDSFGGTGLTTAQLQSGSASGLGSAFAGGTNGLYPYLKSFFPAGVQAITGTAQTADGGALAGARIDIYTGGNPVGGTLVSGANGYVYQPVAAGTLPASGSVQIGASLTPRGGSAVTGLTYTDGATLSGPVLALGSITAGQNRQTTARTLASALPSDLDATFGSGPLATLRTALANTPLIVTATGASFILDQALTASANVTLVTTGSAAPLTLGANLDVGAGNTLTLTAAGAIDQTGGTITAGTLTGSSGGAATLTQTGNAIATLGPFSAGGALSLATAQALTVAGTVSAGQTLSLTSSGDLTLASGAQVRAAGDIALATSGAFVNDAGGGAVSSSGGRWLIYSANAAGDTFGGLDSGNTAVWNTAAGGAVTQSGNRYVFAEQPTLTVTTTDLTKTYGQDAAASVADAYTLTGLRPAGAGAYRADTAATALPAGQLVTSAGSGAQADVARSPYAIVADFTGLTSPAGYALSAVNAGHLTVNPATIAVSGVTGVTKTYDGTAALPAGASGVAVSGVLFGDAVDVSAASAAYDGANAGSHAVLVSGLALTGAKAGNYQLSATAVTGSGTIDPAALTITAADRTKTYGQTLDLGSTGFTAAGILGTDAVTGVGLSSAGAAAAADVAGGPYAITAANAQGTGLANYAITYRPGLLTVTPATLTVTGATGVNKTYDGTAALPAKASGVAVSGVLFGDAVDVSAASAAYDGANAGSRAVLVSGLALTGAKAGNYQLSATAVTGSGTIDPAALTYTANAATRAYGAANPTLTGTVSGFVNGENQSGATTGTLAFTTGATPGSDVGRYAVTGSGLTAVNGNYVFVQAVGNETALGITPVPITVTANSGRSIYGDSPVDPGWSATGLQNGQGVDVLTGLSSGFGLTAATAAGRYALAVSGTLSNGNYVVTARNPGGFIIDPRPITITADAQTRLYGDANPSLTYTVGGRGLVDGDALTGTLATMATGTSAIGSYAITQGTLAASPDYAVTYRGAVLTVTARSITPTVDAQTQAPSSAGPTPTSTVGGRGLADGDAVSGGQAATTATRTSGVAADTTAQGSPTDSAGTAVVSQAASSDTSRAGEAAAGATIQETPVPVANAVAGSQADLRVTPASIVPTNLANSLVRDVLTAGQPAEIILTRAADGTLMLSNSRFDGTRVCLSEAGGCFAVPLGTAPGPQASATDTLSAR